MPHYMCLHLAGMPPMEPTPEQMEEGQKWMAYFEKLGDALVDGPGMFGQRRTVGGEATSNGSGYFVLEAADLDTAAQLLQACPGVMKGESVEVIEMPMHGE